VDPLPEFQKVTVEGTLPRGFPNTALGIGHLNSNGHAVVGQLLAEQIEAILR